MWLIDLDPSANGMGNGIAPLSLCILRVLFFTFFGSFHSRKENKYEIVSKQGDEVERPWNNILLCHFLHHIPRVVLDIDQHVLYPTIKKQTKSKKKKRDNRNYEERRI